MTAFDTLERQLRDATPRRRRSRRAPVAAFALAAAAVIAALVLAGGGAPPTDEREVVAPAVTYLTPDPDKIVYVRTRSIDHEGSPIVAEQWHRGRESRELTRWTTASDGKHWEAERVTGTDSVLRQINEEGEYHEIRTTQTDDAKRVIEQQQAGFLEDFRRRMSEGTLDPAPAVFAERPAVRYHVAARSGVRPEQSYYVDRETGAPLGFTSEWDRPKISMRQTVEAIELLDPTPENLVKVRELTLERR